MIHSKRIYAIFTATKRRGYKKKLKLKNKILLVTVLLITVTFVKVFTSHKYIVLSIFYFYKFLIFLKKLPNPALATVSTGSGA